MATVARDLSIVYHLASETEANKRYKWVTPCTDEDEPRVAAMWPHTTTCSAPSELIAGVGSAMGVITVPASTSGGGLLEIPHSDVYYRIWVVPSSMSLQNPAFNTDIPFIVWSAWEVNNTLTTITPTGTTGLTLSISAPLAFLPVEQKTVNLQVTTAAPAVVDASYLFTFTFGSGTFDFEAVLIEWIREIAEIPVTETWTWLTDVIRAWDSTEQRVAARRQPRRLMEFPMLVANDTERRTWYDRFYNYMASRVLIPFHQYHTLITANSAVSATTLTFTLSQTDVRANEYVIIYRPTDGTTFVVLLGALTGTGANTASPLTQAVNTGDMLFPAAFGRLVNRSAIEMGSVAGNVQIGAYIIDFRTQFNRPGSVASITTFDSLPVLTEFPVVTRSKADEQIDAGAIVQDAETGVYSIDAPWTHAFVEGRRQFYIPRRLTPVMMDYWRDFLTQIRGMQGAFLLPTHRADLVLNAIPLPGAVSITVQRANYATAYWPYDTYKRLQFKSTLGSIIYRKIDTAATAPGDTSILALNTALPVAAEWGLGFTISFLNRVRLGSDTAKLSHYGTYSLLDLVIRTTDQ